MLIILNSCSIQEAPRSENYDFHENLLKHIKRVILRVGGETNGANWHPEGDFWYTSKRRRFFDAKSDQKRGLKLRREIVRYSEYFWITFEGEIRSELVPKRYFWKNDNIEDHIIFAA